jgi:outer membrane receptor protein involved in Fe transport
LARGIAIDRSGHGKMKPTALVVAMGVASYGLGAGLTSAGSADSGADSSALGEINVTAQRRVEDVKEVPTSISVLGGAALENSHIEGLEDISRAVPGVSFAAGGGPGLDNIEMRGVSSTSGSATVGIYLDDVPITVINLYNGAVEPRLFDFDRVEVLRGPQGTLYGSSSMGGAIRFVSNQPDLSVFGGSASSTVSQTRHGGVNYDEQGVLNVPLVEGRAAIRLGIDIGEDSGYIDNYTLADQLAKKDTNDDKWSVWRLSGKIAADDSLTITPAFFGEWENTGDTSVFYPSVGLYDQQKEVQEPSVDHLLIGSLTVAKNLGWGQLTSISSYFQQQLNRTQDGTYYNSEYMGSIIDSGPPGGIMNQGYRIGLLPGPVYTWATTSVATQELRLASKPFPDSGLSWIGGLFFSDYKVHHQFNAYIDNFNQTFERIYGIPPQDAPVFAGATFPNNSVGTNDATEDEKQYAAFADVSYRFIPSLKGTAGLRYSFAPTIFNDYQGGYFSIGVPPVSQRAKFYATTPKFSLTYDASHEMTLYASVSQGYRIGGSESYVSPSLCAQDLANLGLSSAPKNFNSDSLWSYEAGLKGRFFGDTLSINVDGYFLKWSNIQQTVNLPICGYTITTNVGNAEAYGPELEIDYRPIRDLTLGLSTEYVHDALTKVTSSVGASVGDHILNVPEWMATFRAEYSRSIADGVRGFFRTDYDWTGHSNGAFSLTNPDYSRPIYSVLNASAGVDLHGYEISAFAKNLLDDRKIIQRPALLFEPEGYTLRPFTIGLNVKTNF